MSYIPDFRGEENEKLLSEEDRNRLAAYRFGLNSAKLFFDNADMFDPTEQETEVLKSARECFESWIEMEEIEFVCSLFINADYLPDDVRLVDANKLAHTAFKKDR